MMVHEVVKFKEKLEFSDALINKILQTTKKFQSKIILKRNDYVADCRSILEVLLLGAEDCPNLEIVAEGDDENIAVQDISSIFKEKEQCVI